MAPRSQRPLWQSVDFVEPLETRCLLSLSPITPPIALAAELVAVLAARKVAAATTIPRIVGHFTGKITVKEWFFSKSFATDLLVKSQTGSKIAGTITIQTLGSKISYTGTVNAKRHMVITFSKRGIKSTVTGDIAANGKKITGDAEVTYGIGLSGDMELYKVA